MAPEQAQAKAAIGPTADVYSLGAILYELLTGRPPFKAESALETVLQVLHEEPVPPRRLQPKLPRDLETICLTCLRKEAPRRYLSALALAEDLRRFQAGEPIRARPTGGMERGLKWARRRPALAALLAVSVVACVILVVADQRSKAQLREALQQATTQRQRADEATLEAFTLIVAFAKELGQNGRTAEAVDLVTRGIGKLETLLLGEQYPRQLLAELRWTTYEIRAQFYMVMKRYAEARADWERLAEDNASPMADTYRSLLAVTLAKLGEHRKANTGVQALGQKKGLSANILANLAWAYVSSIPGVRHDPKLSATEKDQLSEDYGARAVALLHRVRAAGFFADSVQLQELRTDTDFDPLRSRADFKKLLAELEAEATTAKPKPVSGSLPRAPAP
jgi:tetratricopeptide (TPR) repeat protein